MDAKIVETIARLGLVTEQDPRELRSKPAPPQKRSWLRQTALLAAGIISLQAGAAMGQNLELPRYGLEGIKATDIRPEAWLRPDSRGVTPLHLLAAAGRIQEAPAELRTDEILLGTKTWDGRSIAEFALAHHWENTLPRTTLEKLNLAVQGANGGKKHSQWGEIKSYFSEKYRNYDEPNHHYDHNAGSPVSVGDFYTPMPYQAMDEIAAKRHMKETCFLLDIGKGTILAEGSRDRLSDQMVPVQLNRIQLEGRRSGSLAMLSQKKMSHSQIEECYRHPSKAMEIYDRALAQDPTVDELAGRFPNLGEAFLADCMAHWTPDQFHTLQKMNQAPQPQIAPAPPVQEHIAVR